MTNNFTGNYSLAVSGTGTITLEGDNSGLSNGITLVSAGLAVDGNSSANALGGGSSTLTLNGTGSQTLNLGGSTQNLKNVVNVNSNGGVLNLANGTLVVTDPANPIALSGLNESSSATISAPSTGLVLGAWSLNYNTAAGQVSTLTGSNNVGYVEILSGSVALNNNYTLGSGAFYVVGASTLTSATSFTNASAAVVDISSASTVAVTGSLDFGTASLNIAGNGLNIATNTVAVFTNGVTGGGMLTKSGNGTLILGGANSTGGTTLNGGTLISLNDGALGANLTLINGLLNLSGNTNNFNNVAFNGSAFQVTNGAVNALSA